MSISLTQLVGGSFQDSLGNLLSGGYLTLFLSNDEVVGDAQICAGVEITVPLDAFGNVVSSPGVFVYATDVMTPINAYYRVTGYTAEGQTAWGINNQQIPSGGIGGGTFDVSQWIPNQVISWFPPTSGVSVTAGVGLSASPSSITGTGTISLAPLSPSPAGSYTLSDITVNAEGQITAASNGSTGSSPVPSGSNVADVPWNFQNRGSLTAVPVAGYSYCQVQFANSIQFFPAKWTVSVYVTTALSAAIREMCVIRTLKDSLTTVDVTPITFGGSNTPLFNSTGTKTSDQISLQIDAAHDYYFGFTGNVFGGSGALASNSGSNSEPLFTSYAGNTNNGGNPLSVAWASSIGAGSGWGAAFLGFGAYFLTGWNAA